MKLILFDIDGTLLVDGGAAGAAYDAAFFDLFSIPAASADVSKHGRSDLSISQDVALQSLGRELTPAELETLHDHYVQRLPQHLAQSDGFRVLDGVLNLCRALAQDQRVLLGLQTGNLEPAAQAKLHQGGIKAFFHFGGFGSDSGDRTELVRMAIARGNTLLGIAAAREDIFVIGDSPYDILAGRANGVNAIGVGTGRSSETELHATEPMAVLSDLCDVNRLQMLLGLY